MQFKRVPCLANVFQCFVFPVHITSRNRGEISLEGENRHSGFLVSNHIAVAESGRSSCLGPLGRSRSSRAKVTSDSHRKTSVSPVLEGVVGVTAA